MNALQKLGCRLGCTLVGLLAACGGDDDGDTQKDASAPHDAGHDAAGPSSYIDSGLPFDAGVLDSGPSDAGPPDAGTPGLSQLLTIDLTTASESPPCSAAGSAARGTAHFQFGTPAQQYATFVTLAWQNLSSPVTGAHIHYGAAGANGPIVLPFPSPVTNSAVLFSSMEYLAAQGAPASFDAFVVELQAGKAYVNVHTQDCPAGEIRGQIVIP